MTPIGKNIIVVDELGNEYESTYIKRAKGLVKNGRARFVDENKICLVCPPQTETEDRTMSETEMVPFEAAAEAQAGQPQFTIEYVLGQVEKIADSKEYLYDALDNLAALDPKVPEDVATQGKAEAIARVVEAREATNQKLLALYTEMLERLECGQTQPESTKSKALDSLGNVLLQMVNQLDFGEENQCSMFMDVLNTIRQVN